MGSEKKFAGFYSDCGVALALAAVRCRRRVDVPGHQRSPHERKRTGDNLAYYGAESGMEKLTADSVALYRRAWLPPMPRFRTWSIFPRLSPWLRNELQRVDHLPSGSQWQSVEQLEHGERRLEPGALRRNRSDDHAGDRFPSIGRFGQHDAQVEVALIPVFQFGVFADMTAVTSLARTSALADAFTPMASLYLAGGAIWFSTTRSPLWRQSSWIVWKTATSLPQDTAGRVRVPKAASGCPLNTFPPPTGGTNCVALPGSTPGRTWDASWSGGSPALAGAANPISPASLRGTLNGYVANSLTGVTNMQLPFVQNSCTSNPPPCTDPIEYS